MTMTPLSGRAAWRAAKQVQPKSRRILSERVRSIVACGEAAVGLQQVSELLPIEGTDFVAVLPPPLQRVTVFSAGHLDHGGEPQRGKIVAALLHLAGGRATSKKAGLEPAPQQ